MTNTKLNPIDRFTLNALNKLAAKLPEPEENVIETDYQIRHKTYGTYVNPVWSTELAIRDGLKSDPTVYKAIQMISKPISVLKWKVYKEYVKNGSVVKEVDPTHPLNTLMTRPNNTYSAQSFFERLVKHYLLSGYAPIFISNTSFESFLYAPRPDYLVARTNPKGIDYYEYNDREGGILSADYPNNKIPASAIVMLSNYDPANEYLGLSPLQACSYVVDSNVQAYKWNAANLDTSRPDYIVIEEKQTVTSEEFRKARDEKKSIASVKSENISTSSKGKAPQVLTNATVVRLDRTAVEMDYVDSITSNIRDIANAFNIPPELFLPDKKYDNYELAMYQLYEDAILPLIQEIQDTLNFSSIVSAYTIAGKERFIIEADLTDTPLAQYINTKELENDKARVELVNTKLDVYSKLIALGYSKEEAKKVSGLSI